jgi:uncharacterized membrane protein YjjP (DUF1212 family)
MKESLSREDEHSLPAPEAISTVALEAGRMLMESGASAANVERIVDMVARGLGADCVDLRIGFASLATTIKVGELAATRMRKVDHIGVNQRLDQELWTLAKRVSRRELSAGETCCELVRLKKETPFHKPWITAVAVGLACAAFGRLLGVDWNGIGPVFIAAAAGQYVRRELMRRCLNLFICTTVVSFLSSLIGSLGARWAGSEAITIAMIASTLLLVPGVPAVNAQSDILEGYPTLGSARAVTVAMTLIFIAVGMWTGPVLLGVWQ